MKLSEYLKQNNMSSKEYFDMQKRRSKGKMTLSDYRREKHSSLTKAINFDTFESDLNSLGQTVQNIEAEWQTEETMSNTRSAIEAMRGRLDAYSEYQKTYGGADLTELSEAYKSILDNWDKRAELYGKFKNADAYKAEETRINLGNKFRVKTGTDAETGEDTYRGLTFDEVQAELKKYAPDSDEYKFLSGYTGYTDLNEFDKAIAGKKDYAKTLADALRVNQTKYNPLEAGNTENDIFAFQEAIANAGKLTPEQEQLKMLSGGLEELERARRIHALDNRVDLHRHVMENEDFEEKSKYVSTKNEGFWSKFNPYGDQVYEFINDVDGARDYIIGMYKNGNDATEFEQKGYHLLTEEEKRIYNYYHEVGGEKKANEFLAELEIPLSKRVYEKSTAKWKEWSENPFGAAGLSVLSVPIKIAGAGASFIGTAKDDLQGKDYNPYSSWNAMSNFASDTRKYVGENIAEATEGFEIAGQNIPSFLYQTAMSIADSSAGVVTMGSFYTPLMGMSAFQEKAKELTEAGEDQETVFNLSLANGVAEALFEYLSVDKLLKIKNVDDWGKFAKAALSQAGVEASEEFFTELANVCMDSFIRGDDSDLAQLREELLRRGYTEEEADKKVKEQFASQLAWAGIGGFISGAAMGGFHGGKQFKQFSDMGKDIGEGKNRDKLLDIASMTPQESEAYKLYTDYAVKKDASKIKNAQVGNIYSTLKSETERAMFDPNSSDEQKLSAMKTYGELSAFESDVQAQKNADALKKGEKTVVTEGGTETKIEGIKFGDENKIVTPDGEVAIDDMTFSERDALLVGMAQTMPEEQANLFVSLYDGNVDVTDYANSFNLSVEYARHNYTQSTILENKGVLTEEQVGAIYSATVKATFEAQEKALKTLTEKQGKSMFIQGKFNDSIIDYDSNTTDGSKVNWNSLTSTQRSAIKFAQLFSKATGVNVTFIKSKVVDGKHKGKNGSYDPKTNTIEIDVYAGRIDATTLNDSIIPTLSHEMTHWMKHKAPAIYDSIRNDVMDTLAQKSKYTSEELIHAEMLRMKETHPNSEVTPEDAIDELVARACEDMLSNSKAAKELLAKMSPSEQQGFIAKVKETFENLIQWINDLLAHYKSNAEEAKVLREYKDMLEKISKQWDAMLTSAIEANQALQKEGVTGEQLAKKDIATRDLQFNERLVEKHRKMLEDAYSDEASIDLDTLLARYDKIVEIWKSLGGELNSAFLEDWNNKVGTDRTFSVFKAQAGYKYNVELSSMCKKGIPLFEAIDTIVKSEVMRQLKTKTLGKAEKEILYDILKEHNLEIPCAICYVEQARQREGVIIDAFLNGKVKKNSNGKVTQFKLGWNETLANIQEEMKAAGFDYTFPSLDRSIATDNYTPADLTMDEETQEHYFEALKKVANTEIRRYNKESGKSRKLITKTDAKSVNEVFKGKLPLNLAMFKVLFNEPSSRFTISDDLLYSSMTTQNLAAMHNGLYSLFNSQGGVGGFKTKQGAIVYWADILGKKWIPSKLRDEGGVRNQSNSDFLMYTLLDHAQMYIDFSAKGYYLQAYTKVLSELKLFGLSKGKINASFIPKVVTYYNEDGGVDVEKTRANAGLDENGNPIYDDIEGISHEEAFMLIEDAEYSKCIGGVCIGYSDNHILKLLDDNRIQLIIGFHDKTNDPSKRYRGAIYANNYNGINEATKLDKDGKLKTVHIGFNKFVKQAEGKFKSGKETIEYKGKTYRKNDIPKLAADLYLEHCESKGLFPAYSQGGIDFSKHPNYYKLLADFSLYDINGNYAPHQKVEYNMPDQVPFLDKNGKKAYMPTKDYIKQELKKELDVRDAITEKLADKSEDGIIPQFISRANALHEQQAESDGTLFSMRESVEETKDLVAIHNITAAQLIEALKRKSLLAPSLAVTNKGHSAFGEFSLLFDKNTIDPNVSEDNKLYGADAWTPTQTRLKKNAKFDTNKTVKAVRSIKKLIGEGFVSELFDINSKQFKETIIKADGSIYDAYAHNIGMQTAYAIEQGILSNVPTKANGTVDKTALQEQLNSVLDTDNGWREYKKWLNGISDTIITSYDAATNEDILDNMKAQPSTAKTFKLSVNGELVVPAVEYDSIDALRNNKNRLSENAEEATKSVATDLLSWAKKIGSDTKSVVNAINSAFAHRYDVSGIVNSFSESGIKISRKAATELQGLYKQAVELPTQYFEAKPQRAVGLEEIKAVVMPSQSTYDGDLSEIRAELEKLGVPVIEYDYGSKDSRVDALNSVEEVKFSDRDYDYWLDKIDTVSDEIALDYHKNPVYLKVLDETPAILQKYGAKNYPVIIRFDAMYLAQRKSGAIPGDYHHLGKEIMSNLVRYISDPDALLETKSKVGKTRLIVLTSIPSRTGQALASIEINTTKDVESKYEYYNVVVTFFDIGERYLKTLFTKHNAKLLHKKETLPQVNPQLHTWLRIINESVSKDSLLQDNGKVKNLADRDYTITDNRAAFTEKHINDLYEDYSVSSTSDMMKDYAQAYVAYINPSDFLSLTAMNGEKVRSEAVELDLEKLQAKDDRELPYLEFDEETGEVYEHDGRHRLVAFENAGIEQVAIRLLPISQENKYHRKQTDITLKGQEFHWRNEQGEIVSGRAKGEIKVTAHPLSPSHRPVIEQLFGTGRMQYSDRDNVSVYDLMGETDRLTKENVKLMEDIERLKERLAIARQVKDGNHFNENQLDSVAKYIRKIAGSTYSESNLVALLKDVYSYISNSPNLNGEDLFAQCYDIAQTVLRESKDNKVVSEHYQTALNMLQQTGLSEEDLRDGNEIIESYYAEERTRWLAREIYNKYWTISYFHNNSVKEINHAHRETMQEFRDSYEGELMDRNRYMKLVRDFRKRKDKEIAEVKAKSKERMDAYKENAERKTVMQRVVSKALTLNKWLVKNSKDEHIHEAMKGPVVNLLQAIDFSSKQMLGMKGTVIDRRGTPTRKDISFSKALNQVRDMLLDANVGNEELVALYGHDLDDSIKSLAETIDTIMRTVGDNEFVLNQMTLEELQTLDKIVSTIKQAVTQMNKFHVVNHAKGVANLSQEEIAYADELGKTKVFDPKTLKAKVRKLLSWDNAVPYYAFKRFGAAGQKVFTAFQDGWDRLAFNAKKIIDFAKEAYTSKELKEWESDVKTFSILLPTSAAEAADPNNLRYQSIQMSIPQIMSLYCLQKRASAKGHLIGGGIRVADIKKGKGELISQTDGFALTEKDIETIISTLSSRQKEVADKLQNFMNTVCSDWGNAVSMARFGYRAFGEENYFPIQSDKNNLAVDDETEKNNSLFRLLNMSFTKSLVEGANNRVVISNIFDVFAQHTSDMAKYNALALPVLDAFRWYNYTEKEKLHGEAFITKSVKQSLEKAFGKDGKDYITNFLKDINGQQNVSRDTIGKGFFTNAKIASVALNLRVMLLQPTAFLKASAVINSKYLNKALLHKPKIGRAEKYCGMALWKSLGYYDTDISKGLTDQIKHEQTWKDKVTDFSMKGAEWADKITFGYLWNACELEIRETRKDLKVGSDEFFTEVGKRLREVIYATQVVDSTMTRSQIMRSGNMYEKMQTAFASEPTLAYNMLQDVYMEMALDGRKHGKKIAFKNHGKKAMRVLWAYTITNVVAALIESGFDIFRDDEEEEMNLEEFMKAYLSNFANDMSIIAKVPYFKEMQSLIQGFTSSRSDTQWMESFARAFKGIWKISQGEGNPHAAFKNFVRGMSSFSGIAFYNVYRDLMAALNKLDILTSEDIEELFEDFIG